MDKSTLRKKFLSKRRQLSPFDVTTKSEKIITTLENLPEFKQANSILTYISLPDEVDTHKLIKKYILKKRILVCSSRKKTNALNVYHLTDWQNLKTSNYNILEPQNSEKAKISKIELCIIPGIAFDKTGHRIGYGKGYFDKLLKQINTLKIGLGFDLQILEKIDSETHDIPMDMIITESGIIKI